MRNRLIVVPKDKNAMEELDYDRATPDQLFTIEIEEDSFNTLWNSGFFQVMNNITGLNIDIYEDESITDIEALTNVLSSNVFNLDFPNMEIVKIVGDIKEAFQKAIFYGTGVFLFF